MFSISRLLCHQGVDWSAHSLGSIVIAIPTSISLFEKMNLDFCCGGKRTLRESCSAGDLDFVQSQLNKLAAAPQGASELNPAPVNDHIALVDHIVQRHHVFTFAELIRLKPLMAKVATVHGKKHPELVILKGLFSDLDADRMSKNCLVIYFIWCLRYYILHVVIAAAVYHVAAIGIQSY